MIEDNPLSIHKYHFTHREIENLQNFQFARELWPIVYILSDDKIRETYVGETTDTYARMKAHLASHKKAQLTSVHLIGSKRFNKSATLDIESNLIKFISGDGQYKLMNGNIGLANHNYYQKQDYWEIFEQLWNELRKEGITRHSIEHISNSDLFKYSPYKALSNDQISSLLGIIDTLLTGTYKNSVIEGGAGTGKTILAIFLFKLLNSDLEDFSYQEFGDHELEFIDKVRLLKKKFPNPTMGLVIPMSSFRKTIKSVFKNIQGLSAKMVIGPSEVANQNFDILVVDEAHRLRRRVNLGTYFGAFDKTSAKLGFNKDTCSEVDWILQQSNHALLFYDANQSIKPSDARPEDFIRLKKDPNTRVEKLKSQFRVRGGLDYVKFVKRLLNCELEEEEGFRSKEYEVTLFTSLEDMVREIKLKNDECGLSRLIAGYSWEWVSKKDSSRFDIVLDGMELKWNTTNQDWINQENSIDEVGCIHTTQGYDLNYSGIIFGHEIGYDKVNNKIIIRPENYHDKNGKQSIKNPEELKDFILNIYQTILLRGIKGTYIYACDPALREYLASFIPGYTTLAPEEEKAAVELIPYVNSVPLYSLKAAAGSFGEVQNVEELEWVHVPEDVKVTRDLFACQVIGESMNKVIPSGSICLFKKYQGGSRNGLIVLVEYTDLQDMDSGSCYTVKEYQSKKIIREDGWHHDRIMLKPLSNNPEYDIIEIPKSSFQHFKVIGSFVKVIL